MKQLQPPGWATPKGYANGVAARGTLVFVGGQIGWNAEQVFESDDFIAQTRQALMNIHAVLACAGAGPEHMVRMTWYIVDRVEYNARLRELIKRFANVQDLLRAADDVLYRSNTRNLRILRAHLDKHHPAARTIEG